MKKLNLQVSLLALAFVSGCVPAEEQPPSKLAEGCVLNSDCESPLVCVFRLCHQPCTEARDCPAPGNCQLAGDPPQLVCTQLDCTVAPCPIGQVCGDDQQCRFGCLSAAGCALGQVCVENQCEWPERTTSDGGLPPSTSVNTCRTNSECGADGGVCRFGACGPECLQNRDCAVSAGEVCTGGRCVIGGQEDAGPRTECRYNSNCTAPQICAQFGNSAGTCVDECRETRDCVVSSGGGYVCTRNAADAGGFCERNFGSSDAGCFYSSQCGVAERCDRGSCIPECQADRDCSFGQQCLGNRCIAQGTDGGTCSYNSQCGANQRCSPQGVCIVECLTNRDCLEAAGQCCSSDFACVGGAACFVAQDAGTRDAGLADGGGIRGIGQSCGANIDCIDDDFCNGTESCVGFVCTRGALPCDDFNPCTLDQCTGATRSCAYQTVAIDADHDNHYPVQCGGSADDCDDTDGTVYPGAIELCDWKDNNCNGDFDENLWREEVGARGSISGPSTYPFDMGPPSALRQGNDVVLVASGTYTSGSHDAWRLNASTLSVISGPVELNRPTTVWQQCSINGSTDSRQVFGAQVFASDAGLAFAGMTFNLINPASTCCLGDTMRTDGVFALFRDGTLAAPIKGVLASRSANSTACSASMPSLQYAGFRPPALAWEGQRNRWVSSYWAGALNDVTGMDLHLRTIELDGGVGADRLAWDTTTNPASRSNPQSYSGDNNTRIAVGTSSILVAWVSDRVQPYGSKYVRWVVYNLDFDTVIAGPFDTTVAQLNGSVATTTVGISPHIDGLVFDGTRYMMTLSATGGNTSGTDRVQTLFIAESGVAAPERWFASSMGPVSGGGYEGGLVAGTTLWNKGFAVVVQSSQVARVAVIPRDNPDAGYRFIDLQMTATVPTAPLQRSDMAVVSLGDQRLGLFWSDGALKKTVVSCQQ